MHHLSGFLKKAVLSHLIILMIAPQIFTYFEISC